MSWSVAAIGEVAAVAIEIEKQFTAMEKHPCPQPEETAKLAIRACIAASLSSPVAGAVKVVASGCQSTSFDKDGKTVTACTVQTSVSIDPLRGFVK